MIEQEQVANRGRRSYGVLLPKFSETAGLGHITPAITETAHSEMVGATVPHSIKAASGVGTLVVAARVGANLKQGDTAAAAATSGTGHIITRELTATHSTGVHFPDAVAEPFINAARNVLHGVSESPPVRLDIEPRFTLEESRKLVLAALNNFDKGLGAKALEIFDAGFGKPPTAATHEIPSITTLWQDKARYNENRGLDGRNLDALEDGVRWRVAQVSPDKTFMMRSLAANSPASELGPANNHPYAVIDYHFDGTLNSVIYLAHEVGHTIADDYVREAGFTNFDVPKHMKETQAYFVQHIMYDYLSKHPDHSTAVAAQQHFTDTMSKSARLFLGNDADLIHDRPLGVFTSASVFNLALEQDEHARAQTIEAMLGRQGPKNISEVMKTVGITNQNDMELLAHAVITNTVVAPKIIEQPQQQQQRQHLPMELGPSRPGGTGTKGMSTAPT